MRIKKLMIKGFGTLRNWEQTFDPFWTEVPFLEGEAEETVNKAIIAVLFGFSPHQHASRQRLVPAVGTQEYSAAMMIETDDGEYLIGRNFTRESLEVFKRQTKRLFPLSSMALMDLLFQEIRFLNPLDFEVISVFENGEFAIEQNAPLIREHIQKLVANKGLSELLINSVNEGEIRQKKEELTTVDELLRKLDRLQAEEQRLATEENRYGDYEKFLSPTGEDLLAITAREYTAATLETSFYEEQIREEAETRAVLGKEVATLRQKIASFDPALYTKGMEQKVTGLLAQRTELNRLLQETEELLEQQGRKGIWSSFGGKDREIEIKKRISAILQKLASIREELRRLLKNKKPEEFLKEKALLDQYKKDLVCLERPSVLKKKDSLPWKELERARRKEETLRRERTKLLALAGQEDLEDVQTKVRKLSGIKQQRKLVAEELSLILKEVDQGTLEEARRYLTDIKKRREEELKAEKDGAIDGDGDLAALLTLYRDAGRLLSILTEGQEQRLMPRLEGNLLRFSVWNANSGWRSAAEVAFCRPDLPALAFRLALAKAVWGEGQPLLFLDDFSPWLTSKTENDLRNLLEDWFGRGQIICRVSKLPSLRGE